MFDGVDEVVLPVRDLAPLRRLYVEQFGFRELVVDADPDPVKSRLWGTPPASRTVLLGKPKSHGGWIQLVEVPGLRPPEEAGRPDRVGPYALDFYLRNAARTEQALEDSGWHFTSPAVQYPLPGTSIQVRERMLVQATSGLLHACVQYRPRGTRCVIDRDPGEESSEVVAVVCLTDRYQDAVSFARDVLGGQKYFAGRFDGPPVEEMLRLKEGEGFEASLFRGPGSRNARLEFAETIPGGTRSADPVPRVVLTCTVTDLPSLAALLREGSHGSVIEETIDGVDHLALATPYGARFVFRADSPTTPTSPRPE